MIFRRRKSQIDHVFSETSTDSLVLCDLNYSGKTKVILPMLSEYGENILCDYRIISNDLRTPYELLYLAKIYDSEKKLRFSQWDFMGCSLKITDDTIMDTIFSHNGKVFERIIPSNFLKNKKIKGLSTYSNTGRLSERQESLIREYRDWLENNLCFFFSYTYAIYFVPGEVQIVFWDPELNVIDTLREVIKEALEVKYGN